MGAPIVHFEVNCRDGKHAQEFYGALFGWDINANNPINYGLVNTGTKKGIQGGVGQVDVDKSSYVTFYAEVDNLQKYLDRAVLLGGRIVLPVTAVPNMVTFAQFADPEGNVIGLVKSTELKPTRKVRKPARRNRSTRKR